MKTLFLFGLGALCGFVFTIIVLFLYCAIRINYIDKK